MPCWTRITNELELTRVAKNHAEMLEAALRDEYGHDHVYVNEWRGAKEFAVDSPRGSFRIRDGKVTSTMSEERLSQVIGVVSQAVIRTAVKLAAERFNWTVEEGEDRNHFDIVKH